MAGTGLEGGMRQVLREMADRLALTYARNEIQARVYDYWNQLTVDERLEAGKEYLAKYGHLLPGDLTEGGGFQIRANLPRVLCEHPILIRRLRQLGR